MQENKLIEKRFAELDNRAFERKTVEYTEFLNYNEISILKSQRFHSNCTLFGGYSLAERCIAAFGEADKFPVVCIKLEPRAVKFAEKLGHRDFLGTIIGTGINRNVIGDIVIKDKTAYVFCLESIADYLITNIDRVKHTSVSCVLLTELPEFINKEPDTTEINIASSRVDAVISAIYRVSRSEASKLIRSERVYINAIIESRDSKFLNGGDMVSVRGKGRFLFEGAVCTTKKDRLIAAVKIYT